MHACLPPTCHLLLLFCCCLPQIKRCDEMARQLRFFTSEVEKAGILVAPRLSADQVGRAHGRGRGRLGTLWLPCLWADQVVSVKDK